MKGMKPKEAVILLLPLLAVLPFWYLFKGIFRMNAELPAAFMAAGCSLFPALAWLGSTEEKPQFIFTYALFMAALQVMAVILLPWMMMEMLCAFGSCDRK